MRSKILLASLFLLVSIASSQSWAKTAVWKVTKNDNTLYLGGTVHLLAKEDYPLPASFDEAYKNSQDIVLETNVSELGDISFQVESLRVMTFQDHRSLSTELDRKNYLALTALLESKGMPMAVFEKFTPAGVSLTLAALEMQKMGMMESLGVEKHFSTKAKADEKEMLFLETPEEQLSFIESMNSLDPNALIQSTIKDMAKFEEQMNSLKDAWRQGELSELEATGIDKMQSEFPAMYKVLLVNRNNAWMKDIDGFIQSKDVEFVLVGALHMAGKDGLVAQLKANGYKVEQLD